MPAEQLFSTLLYMCSAAVVAGAARDRVVGVAVDVIGREGVRAATVRRIAAESGVSPALVMHHFGSKSGLVLACDRHVLSVVDAAMTTLAESGRDRALQAFLGIDGATAAMTYIGRSMQEGGAAGRAWFDRMMQMTIEGLAQLEATGDARTSSDPMMRALLLIAMDLGVVFMRPLVEERFGVSLTDPALSERWIRTEFELLSLGVLTTKEA